MINIIKRQMSYLSKQKNTKKYIISPLGLQKFIELKPRSQKLLHDLLSLIGPSCNIDAVTLDISYCELGFNNPRNFYKYRDELVSNRMIFVEGKYIFINPTMINYLNHRQKNTFFAMFNLNAKAKVNMNKPIIRLVNSSTE